MVEKDFSAIGRVVYELGEARKRLACLKKRAELMKEDVDLISQRLLIEHHRHSTATGNRFVFGDPDPNVRSLPTTDKAWPTVDELSGLVNDILSTEARMRELEKEARNMGLPIEMSS